MSKTKKQAIADAPFALAKKDPVMHAMMVENCSRFIGDLYFKPWMVLQQMDKTGGFNGKGLNLLRGLENLPKHGRGVLPEASTVHKTGKRLVAHRLQS